MARHVSDTEREALIAGYRRAYGPDVEVLSSPQGVNGTSAGTELFSIDERVAFSRPDSSLAGQKRWHEGDIVLFLRFVDPVTGTHTFAVILADGADGRERQYRVPVEDLSRIT